MDSRSSRDIPMTELDTYRRFYAEELRAVCRLQSEAVVEAFARVPRERFLGSGPWQIRTMDPMNPSAGGYYSTEDDDPRRIYHNIAVAIDPSRDLNNGHPGTLATWIEALGVRGGDRVVHIGAGTGYYTAIIAETCGPSGSVLAFEADEGLALRAAENLRPWSNVLVSHGDGTELAGQADAIFVNAGVTYAHPAWLDSLSAEGGRLLLPVTASFGTLGKGFVVRLERTRDHLAARGSSLVMIYNCTVARDEQMGAAIGKAMMSGAVVKLRSLRRESHAEDETCVVHREGACLSAAS
jgi:protein-L-isoaspartate(D-aspartate) O-methyltransferase